MSFIETLRKRGVRRVMWSLLVVSGLVLVGVTVYNVAATPSLPLAGNDSISSWKIDPAYQPGSEDEKRIRAELDRLKASLGKGSSDYELYVGIAGEYVILGDAKNAYTYLEKAIELNPNKALAYFSLGQLMERLGAIATARIQLKKAVSLDPQNAAFNAYLGAFTAAHP